VLCEANASRGLPAIAELPFLNADGYGRSYRLNNSDQIRHRYPGGESVFVTGQARPRCKGPAQRVLFFLGGGYPLLMFTICSRTTEFGVVTQGEGMFWGLATPYCILHTMRRAVWQTGRKFWPCLNVLFDVPRRKTDSEARYFRIWRC